LRFPEVLFGAWINAIFESRDNAVPYMEAQAIHSKIMSRMFHPRLSFVFFFSFLVAASFALTGCEENCDDCQAAIDHMYAKMPDNNCNPSFMADAVKRINDNCNKDNQNATYIVNCAAENCVGLSAAPPFCESPGVGIPFLVDIYFSDFGSPLLNVEMLVNLLRNGAIVEQQSLIIGVGSTVLFAEWQYNDGDQLVVQLYTTEPTPVALTPAAEFDMRVRPSNQALLFRGLTFGHDPTTNEYTVETRNF